MPATMASAPGMIFFERSVCRYRRTAATTTGAGSPVSPSNCRILSTAGIARRREGFTARILTPGNALTPNHLSGKNQWMKPHRLQITPVQVGEAHSTLKKLATPV